MVSWYYVNKEYKPVVLDIRVGIGFVMHNGWNPIGDYPFEGIDEFLNYIEFGTVFDGKTVSSFKDYLELLEGDLV